MASNTDSAQTETADNGAIISTKAAAVLAGVLPWFVYQFVVTDGGIWPAFVGTLYLVGIFSPARLRARQTAAVRREDSAVAALHRSPRPSLRAC